MIISFAYTDKEIMEWSLSITRLKPKVTIEVMRKITDMFLNGDLEFDRNKGLLNYTAIVYRHLGIFESSKH